MNESQYYAPAIQAYIEATRVAQQQQQVKSELENRKQQQAIEQQKTDQEDTYRQRLLDQAQEKTEQEGKYQAATLENQHQMRLAATDQAQRDAFLQIVNLVHGGTSPQAAAQGMGGSYNPGQSAQSAQPSPAPQLVNYMGGLSSQQPGSQQPQQNQLPNFQSTPATPESISLGGHTIPVAGLQTQAQAYQDSISKMAQQAGAITAAQKGAAEPFEIAKQQRESDEKADEEDQRANVEYIKANTDTLTNKLDRVSREKIAKMTDDARQLIAGTGGSANPDLANPILIGLATGQLKPNLNKPEQAAAYKALIAQGGRVMTPQEGVALHQMAILSPTLDKLEDFADKNLQDNQAMAWMQGVGLHTNWPSDTKNKLNQLTSQAMQVAKTIDGVSGGRIPIMQLKQVMDGFANGGITKTQAHSNLDYIKANVLNKETNAIMGGMPDWQKDLVTKQYGVNAPEAPALQTPTQPTSGTVSGQPKVAQGSDILNYARASGIDIPTAIQHAQQAGYQVQQVPQGPIQPTSPVATAPGPTQ